MMLTPRTYPGVAWKQLLATIFDRPTLVCGNPGVCLFLLSAGEFKNKTNPRILKFGLYNITPEFRFKNFVVVFTYIGTTVDSQILVCIDKLGVKSYAEILGIKIVNITNAGCEHG